MESNHFLKSLTFSRWSRDSNLVILNDLISDGIIKEEERKKFTKQIEREYSNKINEILNNYNNKFKNEQRTGTSDFQESDLKMQG